eukprot:6458139-Amphidinium_carterae.1
MGRCCSAWPPGLEFANRFTKHVCHHRRGRHEAGAPPGPLVRQLGGKGSARARRQSASVDAKQSKKPLKCEASTTTAMVNKSAALIIETIAQCLMALFQTHNLLGPNSN